jgi:hypothetical protein
VFGEFSGPHTLGRVGLSGQSLSIEAIIGFTLLLIGLLGAGVSILLNILASHGPQERTYIGRCSLGIALVFFCLLSLMYYLPSPWRWLVLVLYLGAMPVMIYRTSIRRQLIREEELSREGESGSS